MKSTGDIRRHFAPWNDPEAVPYIRFENVSKRFGDVEAVRNLSLDIYEREFFALLGASGCGKSTLLRMLAGFERPSAGRILLDGQDLTDIPPYRRPVNMMFQSYALFPHMTVEANIAFGLKQEGMPKERIRERVREMVKLVKLEALTRRKPHELSGGQRQRVALARSLAKQPKVLLLDEPLGALDRKLREQTQFDLADLQQTLGLTFIIVTHDQDEAMTLADRIAVMDHGEVLQVGPPNLVYESPANRFVADFIGSVNLFDGTGRAGADGMLEIDTDAGFVIRTAVPADLAGARASFAVRPEKIRLSRTPPDERDYNAAEGEVWDIAYFGDVTVYHLRLDSGQMIKVSTVNSRRFRSGDLTWEDRAWIHFASDSGVVLEG